jgi:hypothetical protein
MAEETEKKEKKTFLQKVGGVILDFADWLGQERAYRAILDDMGLDAKKAPQFPPLTLTGIKDYVTKPSPGLEAWISVIADVRKLYESIRSVWDAIADDLGAEAAAEETFQTFVDLLASNYVRDRWFHLYVWMEFARFSTEPMTLYGPQGTAAQRFYGTLKALLKFALAPVTLLKGPPMKTEADARKWSDSTFLQLAEVFAFIGHSEREIGLDTEPLDDGHFKVFYGFDQPAGALTAEQLTSPIADAISQRMLSVQVRALPHSFQDNSIQVEGALRFSLAWVPEEHGGKGLFISVGGSAFRFKVDRGGVWAAQAEATFDAPFSVQLGGKDKNFRIDSPNADPELHVGATIASKPMPPGERRFRFLSFGDDNGFDIGRIALSGTLAPDDARVQLTFYHFKSADRRHRGRGQRCCAGRQRISQCAGGGDGIAGQRHSARGSHRQEPGAGAAAESPAEPRSGYGRRAAEDADPGRALVQHADRAGDGHHRSHRHEAGARLPRRPF